MLELIVCVNERLSAGSVSCAGRGSRDLAAALERAIAARGLPVEVVRIHCFGRCAEGPNARIAPGGAFLRGIGPGDVAAIVDRLEALAGGAGQATP